MENFPFFSELEFNTACEEFASHSQKTDWNVVVVRASHKDDDRYLKVVQNVSTEPSDREDHEVFEDSFEEIDEEAVHYPQAILNHITVEYHIVMSKSYSVPMLLLFLHGLPSHGPRGIDAVYQYLVPAHMKPHLNAIGVLGGISMINHPITDMPCFSIHPCNTAGAMREIGGSKKISGLEYLEIWFGLVAGCVGLYLPKQLAVEIEKMK